MESPEHERRHVIDYLAGQAPDETVTQSEKVASERVLGRRHDVWDVHTDKGRWWVITGLTNLYSHDDFKSMDGVLTFHVGLMMRMSERQSRKAPDRPEPRLGRARRQWEQAAEAQNQADEAEEFQAVGMRCRETLVTFANAVVEDDIVPPEVERPKDSDFVGWAGLVADAVAGGSANARLRAYLKATSKKGWEYVNWLTHAKNAVRFDGEMAVDITGQLLSVFESVIWNSEMGPVERCPSCGSYRVAPCWHLDEDTGEAVDAQVCSSCEWFEERTREPMTWFPRPDGESPAAEGDCLPSSGL